MALLELSHVDTYYGDSHVLFDLSLTVEAGEVVCLLGRNGAGKTTTVRTIIGLTPPQAGRVVLRGRDVAGFAPFRVVRLGIGFVPEDRRIFPNLTVHENLEVARRTWGNGRAGPWTQDRVFELFPILRERARQLGGTLSGGEQQMLTIARTLMGNPEVLLLDEPSEGLAPLVVETLRQQLGRLKASGITMVLAEPNVRFVSELGDRVYIVEKGMVRYRGAPGVPGGVMHLLAHHDLGGFGNCGEGMVVQLTRDGRRVLWLAHESAPKNVTAVDVTDPRKPGLLFQSDLPHRDMRSNSLDLAGDLLVVAYQTSKVGLTPAGFEIFDVADPRSPRSVAFFDASGPHSRGVHHLWFVDGAYVHMASGAADFKARHPKDDQCYRIVDVRQPTRPAEVGRWWLPGTRDGDVEPPPVRHPTFDAGFRAHNTNVYPQRPDRAWIGYLDGGAVILDIADLAHPRLISRWDYHPPFPGFTHTVLPLLSRGLMVVSDEATREAGGDWPKLVWVVDVREETNPVPIATCPLPPLDEFKDRGGRYGAHNLHENRPTRSSSGPSSTAASARSISPIRSGRGKSPPTCRRRRPARGPARSRSTTCSSKIGVSSTPSTV